MITSVPSTADSTPQVAQQGARDGARQGQPGDYPPFGPFALGHHLKIDPRGQADELVPDDHLDALGVVTMDDLGLRHSGLPYAVDHLIPLRPIELGLLIICAAVIGAWFGSGPL